MAKENRASVEALREIGLRMRRIRDAVGLRQELMANELNVTRPILSNIENGKVGPAFDVIYALFNKFDINIHYILDGKGEMYRSVATVVPIDGSFRQVDQQDTRFFRYYLQSDVVRFETLGKFSMLMNREGALIEDEIDRKKRNADDKGDSSKKD